MVCLKLFKRGVEILDIMMSMKILVLILSFLGYILILRDKLDVKVEFMPIIITSIIGITMFVGGIFHIMPIVTVLILIFGIIQLRLLKRVSFDMDEILKLLLFTIIALIAMWLLRNVQFTHYDNFSHWALVVREMLAIDSMPTSASKIIEFNSYPTGTAGFIYYICKIVGETEGIMAFSQLFIIISAIFSCFAFINKKNWYMVVVLVFSAIYFIGYNVTVTELLVDTVLSVLGIALVSIILYYRDELDKVILFTMPIMVFLICIKNSGVYFWIISAICIFYMIKKNEDSAVYKKMFRIYSILVPILFLVMWKIHTTLTFGKSGVSKHSMSIINYVKVLMTKSKGDLIVILKAFFEKTISLENPAIILIIVVIFIAAISLIIDKLRKTDLDIDFGKKMIFLSIIVYVTYTISLLGMYIFSMPINEAVQLAGYERYNKTIVMYMYGMIMLLYMDYSIRKENINMKNIIISIVLILFVIMSSKENISWTTGEFSSAYDNKVRNRVVTLKNDYNIDEEKKYYVYISDMDAAPDYVYYLSKYDFRSNDIVVGNSENPQDIDLNNLDYIVILEKDNIIDNILKSKNIYSDEYVIELN